MSEAAALAVEYKVLTVSRQDVLTDAKASDGEVVKARQRAIVVQLQSKGHPENGTVKLVFTGKEIEVASKVFQVGESVRVGFGG